MNETDKEEVSLSSTQIEKQFTCPYCWETISIILDMTTTSQDFIEDCEVCCHPIHFICEVSDGELSGFTVEKS